MPLNLSNIAPNLDFDEAGQRWVTRTRSAISYPAEGNEHCYLVEDSSFWFQHRNRCILELLRSFPAPGTFFDIGGGNGYVARAVQEAGTEVVLVEPGESGVRYALSRGVRQVIQGTLEDAGLLPGTVPAAGLFDVLEHLKDERNFLQQLNRVQPAGGRLYVTVPAFSFLWSEEDRTAGHWRRYTLRSLSSLVESAGYCIEHATYFFNFLVPPILLWRTVPGWLGLGRKTETSENVQADHELKHGVARAVLNKLMAREEAKIAARKRIRAGASCLLVARKTTSQ